MNTIIRYMFFIIALVLLYFVGKTIYYDNEATAADVVVLQTGDTN